MRSSLPIAELAYARPEAAGVAALMTKTTKTA